MRKSQCFLTLVTLLVGNQMMPGRASSHREAAFAAASVLMDYLKTRAPFWKQVEKVSGKIWVEAQGLTPEKMQSNKSKLPFIYTFVALLVMAWVLAGLMAHLGPGQVTLVNGVISGAFCWLGFVITTLVVNLSFAMRDMRLLWIDGGHWLIVLAVMGAIIGAMGV